ncbi:hypothetical protein P280DRAFT_517998 [Massarina eburnea CBS 473.64]|uniref:Uncharacterized protein n=1 Tax=Massarina eburnea CBS 473.64 TaxID=1395130 RepID=A0A6A6RZX0_9PLEO|nr:hypothetical protein P280DRAFT_517998 [Massarina eburnea CBS 473.64]
MQPNVYTRTQESFNDYILSTHPRLAGIVLFYFSTPHDPVRKEVPMNEMKYLGTSGDENENENDFKETHIGMLNANMLRIMGLTCEYQKYLHEIFEACINGLTDHRFFNDRPALRLLDKVLSSLEGLEVDARIAISAQFSVLD